MNSLRPRLSPHQWGLVCALMAAITYGVFPASLRAVYNEGGDAVFMVIVSTWARALAMSATCFVRGVKLFPNRVYTQQSLISGFWQTVSIFGILYALSYIPGPLVIIIVFSHTLMLLFFMAWRKEIILDLSNSLSTLCALFGLSLVLDIWHRQPLDHWIGMGLAFLSAIACVGRLYVYGHQTKERDPAAIGAENFLVAACLTLPALLVAAPHAPHTLAGAAYVVLGCLGLIGGSFFMFYGISLLGSFQYSLMAKLEPIFTAIFSVLILREVLAASQYLGIALVVGSLLAYQLVQKRKTASA